MERVIPRPVRTQTSPPPTSASGNDKREPQEAAAAATTIASTTTTTTTTTTATTAACTPRPEKGNDGEMVDKPLLSTPPSSSSPIAAANASGTSAGGGGSSSGIVDLTSYEELEDQMENILYTIGLYQRLQARGRYIARKEITQLRTAFRFTRSECQRLGVALPSTPEKGSGGGGASQRSSPGKGGRSPTSSTTPSNHTLLSKIAVAERHLALLEQYVDSNPVSTSAFDDGGGANASIISWRSIIHTPGVRRLQSITIFLFTFFVGVPLSFFLSLLLLYWRWSRPFMLLYVVYLLTIGRPRHPVKKKMRAVRSVVWRLYKDYFPVRLVIPRATRRRFDPQKNYLFGYHPHGIHTFGAISCFGTDANDLSKLLPGIRVHLQTLGVNYYIPFWSYLMSGMGAGDASASCLRATLRAGPGESVALVIGGAEESLVAQPNRNDLILHKRKGFIKIALEQGASLVPVYGFGENNVYDIPRLATHPLVQRGLRLLKQTTGFTIPLISGRGFFLRYGLMPHRRPIVVVVGDPIDLPRTPQPTQAMIDYWQERYISALEKLYAEHKGVYDLEATGLRITK